MNCFIASQPGTCRNSNVLSTSGCGFKGTLFCGLLLVFQLLPVAGSTQEITRLAQLSAWPGVSQLITYDQRVWFVNSQPYKDTNVADIYSFTPSNEKLSYERSLFSQDAGNPVVYNGLLHWPFEDPRRSAGTGEFVVTDGKNWQWNAMQSGSVMHVHAMNVCDNQLVAVTGSWTGQLHRQTELEDWQVQYDYPSGAAPFSRLVNVSDFNGSCIVAAAANGKVEPKLFRIDEDNTTPLKGWPSSDRVDALTVHRDSLFAFADTGSDRKLLMFNGESTTTVKLADGHRPRALHSNGNTLWLATQYTHNNTVRGELWIYTDSGTFESIANVQHAPVALTSFHNDLYIGTYHSSGGALWRLEKAGQSSASNPGSKSLTAKSVPLTIDTKLADALYKELLALVSDPASLENYARDLRRNLARHPQSSRPEFGQAITRLLSVRFNSNPVKMFTRKSVPGDQLIRWYLLTTLAINGHGRVDPMLILGEHELAIEQHGKQFVPSIAAIAAIGWLNQNDKQTLKALITRLNSQSDPLWVTADVIGALTAVTGESFAYDIAAWNQWWKNQL